MLLSMLALAWSLTVVMAGDDASLQVEDTLELDPSVRRRAYSRVRPQDTIELPHEPYIQCGRGYNHRSDEWTGDAFESYTHSLDKSNTAGPTEYEHKVIKSTRTFNEAMRVTAGVKGSGWGVKAQADAAFNRDFTMTAKDVVFIIHASKNLGYEGWYFKHVPKFTKAAQNKLCKSGKFTPHDFEHDYGTYFVIGETKGSALDIWVKITTDTSREDQKISANLQTKWNKGVASASGSSSFTQAIKKEFKSSEIHTKAKGYGNAKDWFHDIDVDDISKTIDSWKGTVSSVGAGIIIHLQRYDDLPDYRRIRDQCSGSSNSKRREEYYINKVADVAVETKLIMEEMSNKHTYGKDGCLRKLVTRLRNLYDRLIDTPEDEIVAKTWSDAETELYKIKVNWNSETNRCSEFEVDCDHLEVFGGCVSTKTYGNNHLCTITVNEDIVLDVKEWAVEESTKTKKCVWDYLELPTNKRFCDIAPNGLRVRQGQKMKWKTDRSVVSTGWKICADRDNFKGWRRHEKSQCHVYHTEFPRERKDNPISRSMGYMSRTKCMEECEKSKDILGRPCVAIEMSTHANDASFAAPCALAWGCDYVKPWSGGTTFIMSVEVDQGRKPVPCKEVKLIYDRRNRKYQYFYFDKEEWLKMTGDRSVSGTHYVMSRGASNWKGDVVVWDSSNGVHGRRVKHFGEYQWIPGDVIMLAKCVEEWNK